VSEVATYAATAEGMTRFRDSARRVAASPWALARRVAASTAAFAAIIAATAFWAVPLVFGARFAGAVPLVLILLPGTLGLGLLRVCGNDLSGRGRPGLASAIATVQALAMGVAYVLLIPGHGATAAAIVSSAGYLAGGVASLLAALRAR
jgi:O-antigen/teichoic acid export membrane protein